MLYIIAAIIILILGAIFGGESGCGLALFLIIGFILWRIGLLGIIFNIVGWVARTLFKVLEWIAIRIAHLYIRISEFFDDKALDLILIGL